MPRSPSLWSWAVLGVGTAVHLLLIHVVAHGSAHDTPGVIVLWFAFIAACATALPLIGLTAAAFRVQRPLPCVLALAAALAAIVVPGNGAHKAIAADLAQIEMVVAVVTGALLRHGHDAWFRLLTTLAAVVTIAALALILYAAW